MFASKFLLAGHRVGQRDKSTNPRLFLTLVCHVLCKVVIARIRPTGHTIKSNAHRPLQPMPVRRMAVHRFTNKLRTTTVINATGYPTSTIIAVMNEVKNDAANCETKLVRVGWL